MIFRIFILINLIPILGVAQDDCKYIQRKIQFSNSHFISHSAKSNFNILHHKLHLYIDPDTLYINGFDNITIINTDTVSKIELALTGNLIVDSIEGSNSVINFIHNSGQIVIFFKQSISSGTIHQLNIYYHGVPGKGGGFNSMFKSFVSGNPIISTLSQPYGASDWWPCKNTLNDKTDSFDIFITTPLKYKAVSIGILQDTVINGKYITYHWKHRYPIADYLVAISVTDYTVYADYIHTLSGDSIKMINYIYSNTGQLARTNTAKLAKIIDTLGKKIGEYPFIKEKYGHAQFDAGGGMEHQTISFVGNFSLDLLIHEVAHQWFGDMITCGSWSDLWLNEGFATYMTGMAHQWIDTTPKPLLEYKRKWVSQITQQTGGIIYTDDTLNLNVLFNQRLTYTKAAMVINLIKVYVGEDIFWKAIQKYIQQFKYGFVKTSDFMHFLEKETNTNLSLIFSQWIYGEGYPIYEVFWKQLPDRTVKCWFNQRTSTYNSGFFGLPVRIRLTGNGNKMDTLFMDTIPNQTYILNPDFKIDSFEFDPESDLICNYIIHNTTPNYQNYRKIYWYPGNAPGEYFFETEAGNTLSNVTIFDVSGRELGTYSFPYPTSNGHIFIQNIASPGIIILQSNFSDGVQLSDKIFLYTK